MKSFLILILAVISILSQTQENLNFGNSAQQVNEKITKITFTLIHSRRIPNYKIVITINNRPENCIIQVKSVPKYEIEKWRYTVVDTSFVLNKNLFTELSKEVLDLTRIDLNRAMSKGGLDGTTCIIEFGTYGASISYHFWSPNVRTEYRGLTDFLALSEKILKIGNLDPEKIF